MKIAGRSIGGLRPPYVVAEISGNHCGSLQVAKRLIREAKKAGADAVKTQCYDPDTITLNSRKPDFIVQSGLWAGQSLYDLYGRACTPLRWHPELYRCAAGEGIPIFSSVFDYSSIDLLETLNCPAYKIASFEIVDLPLIERATTTRKPLIISTGLASNDEILEANSAANKQAAFLHCTSEYPATIEHANLGRIWAIDHLLNYNNPIGVSDHTDGHMVAVAATAMKVTIIEKHLKLDNMNSEDASFSLTPAAFKAMVDAVRATYTAITGTNNNGANSSRQFRRSLYAVMDIKKGEPFTPENVKSVRPGYGLAPKYLPQLIGQEAKTNYRKGDRIQW